MLDLLMFLLLAVAFAGGAGYVRACADLHAPDGATPTKRHDLAGLAAIPRCSPL